MRFPGYANSWIKTTLGDECDNLEYGIGASAIPFDGTNRYLRITDINDPSGEYVSPSFLDEKALLQPNDILLARTGATVGQSFLYESDDLKTYYAGFLIRARVIKGNQRFLYYQLKTDSFWRWVKVMSARSGQPGINAEEYASYPLFVSNDSEMGKVSAFLRIIDKRIEVQNKIIEESRFLIDALCSQAKLSQSFCLQDICECKTSVLKESEIAREGLYPVYGATGRCGYLDKPLFNKPGVAVVKDGAGVGRCFQIKDKGFSTLGTIALLVPKKDVPLEYLWVAVKSISFTKYIVGSGIPHVYFKDYKAALVPAITSRALTLSKLCESLFLKMEIESKKLDQLYREKAYLLCNLFI